MMKIFKLEKRWMNLGWILVLGLFMASCSNQPQSERVILIGIDGMSISGFQQALTPNLDHLIQTGALSLNTRAVMPTVSGPNWSSHLLGAGPEQHGVTSNGWTVDNHTVNPTDTDADGYFPSIFDLIREQKPQARTAMFYDWDALANFYNTKMMDTLVFSTDFHDTFNKAFDWINKNDPLFSFVYVGHPDEAGHQFGWGTNEYLNAIEEVDAALGQFFEKLKNADLVDGTHFIVVTDHGGVGTSHGGLSMDEIEIPWMITGPGVRKNQLISQPNSVVDTAPTIAWLLGLNIPDSWTGKPFLSAFEKSENAPANETSYIPQPVISLRDSLYIRSETLELSSPWPDCSIHYSRKGKEPTINDPVYKSPLLLDESQIVKAACFKEGKRSRVTTLAFTKVIPFEEISIEGNPSEKYAGKGSVTLINRQLATADYHDTEWLGFEGISPIINLKFSEIKSTHLIRIGYLNNQSSWIFPSVEIKILASVDNKKFVPVKTLNKEEIYSKSKQGRNWVNLYFESISAKAFRISVTAQEQCPKGHPGEGKAAWLFLDEIIAE